MTLDPKTEKALETWCKQFHLDHDAQKQALFAQLNGEVSEDDDSLEFAYGPFSEQHDDLKKELLTNISTQPSPSAATRPVTFPYSATVALRVAVCLVAIVGILLIPSLLSKPVYALEDVFDRINGAQSIFMGGFSFSGTEREVPIPTEFYAEKPQTFWRTYYMSLRGDDQITHIQTGYRCSDGELLYQVSDDPDSSFYPTFVQPDLPIWSNIELSNLLSQTVGDEVLFSSAEGFGYVGQGDFGGKRCDMFDRINNEITQRVYIDPKLQVPVGAEGFGTNSDGSKVQLWIIDRIVLDPSEPPEHMAIRAPIEPGNDDVPSAFARFSTDPRFRPPEALVPYAIQFENSSLVCWTDPEKALTKPIGFDLVTPNGDEIAASVSDLGQTNDGEVIWNWVQLTPHDALLENAPSVKVIATHTRTIAPIKFNGNEVAAAVRSMSTDEEATNEILERLGISAASVINSNTAPQPQL